MVKQSPQKQWLCSFLYFYSVYFGFIQRDTCIYCRSWLCIDFHRWHKLPYSVLLLVTRWLKCAHMQWFKEEIIKVDFSVFFLEMHKSWHIPPSFFLGIVWVFLLLINDEEAFPGAIEKEKCLQEKVVWIQVLVTGATHVKELI